MRIVFMGTPQFALPSLQRLIKSDHEIAAVVTQPDRPSGRGQKTRLTPIKELAVEAGLTVHQPEKLKGTDFHETLAAYQPDALVVVAYGKILRQDVLDVPRLGCINVHASMLPKYRGAAPVHWAIINGEATTGVTIMKLDPGMDTGDILAQKEVDILGDDDAQSLADMLSVAGAQALVEVLGQAEREGALEGRAQDDSQATYAAMLKKEDGHLDFSQRGKQIICRMRGTSPWPGSFVYLGGKPIRILRAEPIGPDEFTAPQSPGKQQPGELVAVIKKRGVVARTEDGYLLLTQIQPPGKRAMGAIDCMNGGLLKIGQSFT